MCDWNWCIYWTRSVLNMVVHIILACEPCNKVTYVLWLISERFYGGHIEKWPISATRCRVGNWLCYIWIPLLNTFHLMCYTCVLNQISGNIVSAKGGGRVLTKGGQYLKLPKVLRCIPYPVFLSNLWTIRINHKKNFYLLVLLIRGYTLTIRGWPHSSVQFSWQSKGSHQADLEYISDVFAALSTPHL